MAYSLKDNADNVYYNININNTTNSPIVAQYTEERTNPILYKPSDYYCSVIRFTIPANSVPIFNFTELTYSVSLEYTTPPPLPVTTIVRVYLTYLTQNVVNRTYVYSYQFMVDMINIALGEAYALIIDATAGSPPELAVSPAPFFIYDAKTNLISLMASRFFEVGYREPINSTLVPPAFQDTTIKIWLNGALYTFFNNFDVFFNKFNNIDGRDFQILVKNTGNNLVSMVPPRINIPLLFPQWLVGTTYLQGQGVSDLGINYISKIDGNVGNIPPIQWLIYDPFALSDFPPVNWQSTYTYAAGDIVTYKEDYYKSLIPANTGNIPDTAIVSWLLYNGYNCYQMQQEFDTLYLWNAFRSLVIISNTLPIKIEYLPSSTSATTSASGTQHFRPILSDFEVSDEPTTGLIRNYQHYEAQGEWKMIDLQSDNPLTKVDIQIFWQDNQQRLFPLEILPSDLATIKIVFRKKTVKSNL